MFLPRFTTDCYVIYISEGSRKFSGRDRVIYYPRKTRNSVGNAKRYSAELIEVTVSFDGGIILLGVPNQYFVVRALQD